MITDRLRFSVFEANTNELLTDDLVVLEPQVSAQLSAPAIINFKVPYGEASPGRSSDNITWKNWGQWILAELEIDYEQTIVAVCIVRDCKIDPKSGDMTIEAIGFSEYPKGIPWLENWNDIAVDPFEIVERIWAHLQSSSNANLGVEVYPTDSGTQMLPGYGFDGAILVFDFFALFIRAVDFVDCGDMITGLSRDIPFDYIEEAVWNSDKTDFTPKLKLAYPSAGVKQEHLSFVLGENVIEAELADEEDIEWVSDVIIRGWFPGKVYSSKLGNSDMTRFRRTIMEEDAKIDSTERAAAWAKRKLTRRNVPKYWSKILIDPSQDSGQFGNWKLGDTIFVEGDYPWLGKVALWHKIMGWTYDESSGQMQLSLKVEGAFNYDPIEYNPNPEEAEDKNLLTNGYFDRNLSGWKAKKGQWFRNGSMGYDTEGCVRIDCDDNGENFESHKIAVVEGQQYDFKCAVRYQDITATGSAPIFMLRVNLYQAGGLVGFSDLATVAHATGTHTWIPLSGSGPVPPGVDEISLEFVVDTNVTGGVAFWDDAKVLRV